MIFITGDNHGRFQRVAQFCERFETSREDIAILNEEYDETCKINVQNLAQDHNVRIVDFYCLEPRQGATITIYHTNKDEKDTEVIGKIKGGKVLNRSFEMIIEDGEICMSTCNNKIYFGGLLSPYIQLVRNFPEMLGISIVKRRKSGKE